MGLQVCDLREFDGFLSIVLNEESPAAVCVS